MFEQIAPESGRPVSFRVGLYEALRRTAEAQRDAVRADNLDRFYNLLQEREKLLEKTEGVQQQLEGEDRGRASDLVRQIMRVDQETERLLMGRIEEARHELDGVAVGKQALAAYGYLEPRKLAEWRS